MVSDLGLHCLPMTLLRIFIKNGLNETFWMAYAFTNQCLLGIRSNGSACDGLVAHKTITVFIAVNAYSVIVVRLLFRSPASVITV